MYWPPLTVVIPVTVVACPFALYKPEVISKSPGSVHPDVTF